MNEGDTLKIILNYTINGVPIEDLDLNEIEVTIGRKSYYLTEGDIVMDTDLHKYKLSLAQEDTFEMGGTTDFQVRFKKDEDVTSTKTDTIIIGRSLSREVI